MTHKAILTLIISAIVTGCAMSYSPEEILLPRSDISLTYRGVLQVEFDPAGYQIGYHDRLNEFRIYDDRLANWFTIRCSERPAAEGDTMTAEVSWTGRRGTHSFKGLTFTIEKKDENGYLWLWNSSHSIGIIIKEIV